MSFFSPSIIVAGGEELHAQSHCASCRSTEPSEGQPCCSGVDCLVVERRGSRREMVAVVNWVRFDSPARGERVQVGGLVEFSTVCSGSGLTENGKVHPRDTLIDKVPLDFNDVDSGKPADMASSGRL